MFQINHEQFDSLLGFKLHIWNHYHTEEHEADFGFWAKNVKIGVIRTANRDMSGHCNGTSPDSVSVDIRTLCSDDRYVRTA